jgi:hypothetical protein
MVYRFVTPCSLDRQPEISEEQVASFFRIYESAMRGSSRSMILLVRPKFGQSTGCCDLEGTKGNVRRWKPLPSNGQLRLRRIYVCCSYSDIWSVTQNIVIICCYKLFKSSVNPITNPNPVSSHITWQYEYKPKCERIVRTDGSEVETNLEDRSHHDQRLDMCN